MNTCYKEAYCLMLYRCNLCGTIEVLWNSRDGVTPFSICCSQCHRENEFSQMIHIGWQLDICKQDYKPFEGQRIFIGKPDNPQIKEWKQIMEDI